MSLLQRLTVAHKLRQNAGSGGQKNVSNKRLEEKGLVLLGCGKMGSALLEGWLADGLPASSVWVLDPYPNDWVKSLTSQGLTLNSDLPKEPAICVIAVKPQMMQDALPSLRDMRGSGTVFLSIAAGTSIAAFEEAFGQGAKIVRSMPNTPAAIGKGITALVGNDHATAEDMDLADSLLAAVGQTVRLKSEADIDAVTAVSGSGPAYVFYMIDCLAKAGIAQGLDAETAMQLAKATVAGAGAYADAADLTPEELRINVTSPGGTTAAALEHLMNENNGLEPLINRAVAAAADRGRELGKAK